VLGAAVAGKADGSAGQRVWTLRVSNTGLGAANTAQITGLTLTQLTGTPCAPAAAVVTTAPIGLGTIAAGANASGQVTLNFAGCDSTARFALKVGLGANGGAYSGSTTINNQTK
jgi:hypothetical protein